MIFFKLKVGPAQCVGLGVLLASMVACRQPDPPMFEVMKAASTGIDFTNIPAQRPQLNILYYLYYYNGGGVATGDVNNDGLVDIFFTANQKGGNKLYLNKGNFQFEDVTENAGVAGQADWCTGATMADVNGDGLLDIFTCAVAGSYGLQGQNELYLNQGDGTFLPVAASYGLQFSGLSTQAVFFDFDHDGDLDMYLLNHSKKPHSNIVHANNRKQIDSLAGDRLYRQDQVNGAIRFVDVSAQAGIYQSNLGYGLGVSVADFNNDGWEDIFVGNDFHENDYYYLNNGDGTFSEEGSAHFGHYSRFSMGNDAADYNNDGNIDLITVDMLPPDEKTLKTYGSDENPNNYYVKLTMNAYQDQVSRNCLQRNNANGTSFSETALLSGVSATDWSWCPLFADFDNDGNKDLFISSGIVKRPVDLDYIQFVSAQQMNKGLELTDKYDAETIDRMPDGATHPFFFRGTGTDAFAEVSDTWGTKGLKGYYNGAAWADLDNDGDLDMVINSLLAEAVVLKNNTNNNASLRVEFRGYKANTFGVGAKAWVFCDSSMQYQQLMPSRGFMSASEPVLHFGLGKKNADSVLIVWPDNRFQMIYPADTVRSLTVAYQHADSGFVHAQYFPSAKAPYLDVTADVGIDWAHQENDFSDFNRQYLIPHKLSTRGPKMAVADVNGDGLQDFYVCGALNQSGMLMVQKPNGTFEQGNMLPFAENALIEEVDVLFFDADGDGDEDLYIATGGYQFEDGQPLLADHLYFNDGQGNFEERKGTLPPLLYNKSCVAAADIDQDGDMDLFVGALANASGYGNYHASYFLVNDGKGNFSKLELPAGDASPKGMITASLFTDINGDKLPDLVVAGEWMPLTVYVNRAKGLWKKEEIPGTEGWWQSLLASDVNGDGNMDIVAGNWGLNNKMVAGKDGSLKLYIKDFDKNGRQETILTYFIDGKEYTFLPKDELERVMPVLKKAYLTYSEVAGQTVQFLLDDLFKDYTEWTATTMASSVFINKGNGQLSMEQLSAEWQLAPVMALSIARNGTCIAAGGNFSGTMPYEGKYDALPLSLYGTSTNGVSALPVGALNHIRGEIRDLKMIKVNGIEHMLVARNNMPLLLLKNQK